MVFVFLPFIGFRGWQLGIWNEISVWGNRNGGACCWLDCHSYREIWKHGMYHKYSVYPTIEKVVVKVKKDTDLKLVFSCYGHM